MAHRFVDGKTLDALLRTVRGEIKLLPLSGGSTLVPPAQALAVARTGDWVGKISQAGTVRYLKQIDHRAFVAEPGYWDGRGVIRFHPDLRSIPERVKRREQAARLG
jgi:hypothetical protein